jgi:predicted DNA-binding mobile mystery protein A
MRIEPSPEWAASLDEQINVRVCKESLTPMMYEWSETIRTALGLTAAALGKRMGISQAATSKLERSEEAGTISIERLSALADALDCDFVYGFLPRQPLAETATRNQQVFAVARRAHRKLPRLK